MNTLPHPEDSIDYITVSDPVIHADGMNKYTSYRVDCRPSSSYGIHDNNNNNSAAADYPFLQNNQSPSSVLRRYSDFLWLYERLQKERAGSIVPPIPEKQAVSRFSPEFVEERRGGESSLVCSTANRTFVPMSECSVTMLLRIHTHLSSYSRHHQPNTTKQCSSRKIPPKSRHPPRTPGHLLSPDLPPSRRPLLPTCEISL